LFQFALGPVALAFIGAGSKDDILAARQMIAEYGDRWTGQWLHTRGLPDWAEYLDRHYSESPSVVDEILGANGHPLDTDEGLDQRETH
jgi:hypothetical protein